MQIASRDLLPLREAEMNLTFKKAIGKDSIFCLNLASGSQH